MALAATMVFQVQNGGSDTQCGGGFTSALGGTDYSQQNAAQATGTVTSSTTTVTATTSIFTSVMVGNIITDGTTYKEITAYTNGTTITVDSAPSWTSATIYVGGALASPGKAASLATVAGQQIAIQYSATPYPITSATTNISGGCVAPTAATTIFGYNTTRSPNNSDSSLPTLQLQSVSAATILGTTNFIATNLILDGNAQTTSRGVGSGTSVIYNSTFKNFTNGATGGSGTCVGCLFTGCSGTVACSANAYFCVAEANTIGGFGSVYAESCIAYGNTGASSDGFSGFTLLTNCVSASNGRDGFHSAGGGNLVNCAAESNTGYGYNNASGSLRLLLLNCASYNNTSGRSNNPTVPTTDSGPITGSGSMFTNTSGGVFTTSGGGVLRATSFPSSFPGGLTANYRDMGAAQHQDPTTASRAIVAGC